MEKKILIGITIVFFALMAIFTFVSRHTAVSLLPEVETGFVGSDGSISSSAIRQDEAGRTFVYVLTEKDTILGKAQVTYKIYVEVTGEQGNCRVLTGGLRGMEHMPVVTGASEEIGDDQRVRRADDG